MAAAGDTPPEANWASTLLSFSPFLLLIVAFYFFMLRPQKKQQKEMQNMLNSIGTGDVIVTSGGIVGVVVKVKDDMMLIESSADRTKIQIQKRAVHSVLSKAGEDTSEKN
ncbi:MAG: preprotein translocase subunit YajC [Clostridiales bacterium GWF2_36_10]|nr:MAG: preprotein translocase subunit YajC [Clostridiales bacterium GWF2_36_10]